ADACMLSGKSVVPGTTTSVACASPVQPRMAIAQKLMIASGQGHNESIETFERHVQRDEASVDIFHVETDG
ncbi:MAG TPA: hypothetical protein VKA15_15020, partial [Isosphaeraceae bacterium]|nr:hypothetical protein [Isosphaeraceae bacterium]